MQRTKLERPHKEMKSNSFHGLSTLRKYRSTITTRLVQVQHLIKMAYGHFVAVLPGDKAFYTHCSVFMLADSRASKGYGGYHSQL